METAALENVVYSESELNTWIKIEDFDYSFNPFLCRIRNDTTGFLLKNKIHSNGYYNICLSREGVLSYRYLHILICEYFHGERPEGLTYWGIPLYTVDHKNGNKQDNSKNNLEWITSKEQMRRAKNNNLLHAKFPDSKGVKNSQSKLTEEDVYNIRLLWDDPKNSSEQIASKYGVSSSLIRQVGRRASWRHLPERESIK